MVKNNLVSLAKGNGNKKNSTIKKEVVKVVEKPKTPEEERDLKAKETVNKLLEDVNLTPNQEKNDELIELTKEEEKSIDWLQEQVGLLSSENKLLQTDLAILKSDYNKLLEENQKLKSGAGILEDGVIKENIIRIFHELQSNYLNMGISTASRQELIPAGTPNFRIAPAAFINRLVMYFPFLQKEKRF